MGMRTPGRADLNLYGYVSAKVLNATDPKGTEKLELHHATSVEGATKIVDQGFRAGRRGFNFFGTRPDASGAGRAAADAPVNLTIEADLKVEETISKQTFKQWYKEAEAALKKEGFEGKELQKRADAVRYDRLQEHIAKGGKDVYRLERGSGNDFIIASDKAIAGARITKISGKGAGEVLARLTLAGESAAAKQVAGRIGASEAAAARFGTAAKVIKGLGRPLVAVAVAADAYEIYQSEEKARTITSVVGGWSSAWLGAKGGFWLGGKIGAGVALAAGQAGPQVAAPEEVVTVPLGGAIGGIVGGIGGGVAGYFSGREVTETVYDWIFTRGAKL